MLPKHFFLEAVMRGTSSAISLSVHIAIITAAVLGTARARTPDHQPNPTLPIVFPPTRDRRSDAPVAGSISVPDRIDVPIEALPLIVPPAGPAAPTFPVAADVGSRLDSGPARGVGSGFDLLTEDRPEVLAGPLPIYPDLLRQAGIQGRVVFEGIVDTTGRLESHSLQVVLATNPGFVEAARIALLATLFRPARIGGRALRVKVRLPVEFTLRGFGSAR